LTEVTLWGEARSGELDESTDSVEHRLSAAARVDAGPKVGQSRRSKNRPRWCGYCAVLSARAEGSVSIPVSLSR
jgi:hypothetical protein